MPYKDIEKRRSTARAHYHSTKTPQNKERTIPIQVRLPETVVGRIAQIASEGQLNGKYPWKSLGQVARGLTLLGLKKLAEEGDFESKDLVDILEINKQFGTIATMRRSCQSILETAKIELNGLVTIGAINAAMHVYQTAMEQIEDLTISEWTIWVAKELKTMYPEFERKRARNEIPGVSLKTHATRRAERDRANMGHRLFGVPKKKGKKV